MKFRRGAALLTAVALLRTAAPLLAHHSFAAEFDSNKPISVKGMVRKLAWVNPHAYIYVDVKDGASGKVVTWAFEILSPNALARDGWNRDSLKYGDVISIDGYKSRLDTPLADGAMHGNARVVTRADGRRMFSGRADDGGPGK